MDAIDAVGERWVVRREESGAGRPILVQRFALLSATAWYGTPADALVQATKLRAIADAIEAEARKG